MAAALYFLALVVLLSVPYCYAFSTTPVPGDSISKPVRRQRYKGLYPKQFRERYKELRGDEEVISKVINKGSTPAGQHVSIMINETLACLGLIDPRDHVMTLSSANNALPVVKDVEESEDDGDNSVEEQLALYPPINERRHSENKPLIFIDCTLGFGGHSSAIRTRLPSGSTLYGIDQDPLELPRATARVNGTVCQSNTNTTFIDILDNFSNLLNITKERGLEGKVAGLMADLGFSSMQIDDPLRGFSRKFDGPLDMRMNPTNSHIETAAQLIKRLGAKELQKVIEMNSDERYARQIAVAIKGGSDVLTTFQLVRCVENALKAAQITEKSEVDRTVARVMQSLRVAVNDEFGALDALLAALPSVLCSGGRAVVLTFHSGEDRRVKKEFQRLHREGALSSWGREVVRASPFERRSNPRSKCCKLRWCIKK